MPIQEPLFTQENPERDIPIATRIERVIGKTTIFQSFFEGYKGPCEERNIQSGQYSWTEIRLPDGRSFRLFRSGAQVPDSLPYLREKGNRIKWENVRLDGPDQESRVNALNSWKGAFQFKEEVPQENQLGLRSPQIGALHAVHAHWTVSDEPAMIVMPTGTGKTETMLSTLTSLRCNRVLVIVPSLILRDQIFGKFQKLGLLKSVGVLAANAKLPVVGKMKGSIATVQEAEQIFEVCNVVVAVINSVASCPPEVLQRMSELCSHMFIDEAHHIPASTWSRVKTYFQQKRVLQFTATPYRNDGKRVDGKLIYAFPLRKAQDQGYFKPIRYLPVIEFSPEKADRAIAMAAVGKLRKDIANDQFDHILMARAHPISKLEGLLDIYIELAADLNPVIIHSQMTRSARDISLNALRTRASRIVLCDNMLGEGFDFPQLKIAALHDLHKSLAITLQFTGRFTRTNEERLGDATMVANVALSDVSSALRDLYAQDADWNRLVQEMADQAIGSKVKRTEFSASFASHGVDFPAENIQPKMSVVAYKTDCEEWFPEKINDWLQDKQVFAGPSISEENSSAFFVVVNTSEVEWGLARDAVDVHYALYLLHWNKSQQLLFINSTDNDGFQGDLAKLLCGENATRVAGEAIFRALHGINRLVLMNLGLKSVLGRNIKFTMLAGSDVLEGITPAQAGTKTKTNLFALGYEDGERATLGCSLKGRIWSNRVVSDISEWSDWCEVTGAKLLDESITIEEINKWFVIPTVMNQHPQLMALDIDWSDELYVNRWGRANVRSGAVSIPFFDVAIDIVQTTRQSAIEFVVQVGGISSVFRIGFTADGPNFTRVSGPEIYIEFGNSSVTVQEFCQQFPPTIYFENEAVMERGLLFTPNRDNRTRFDKGLIIPWDWTGTNIRKESQGATREPDSIQFAAIARFIKDHEYDVVFDDDGANEVADIVCVKHEGKELHLDLIHCKFSEQVSPGHRISDLYEVCGQAQKCIKWRDRIAKTLRRLGDRESKALTSGRGSRFIVGDQATLLKLQNAAHLLKPKLRVWIVQPGLSKAEVTNEQLELLGATQNYLNETYQIPLQVVSSR